MTISSHALSRLPHYRSALVRLKQYGAVTVFSCDIADALGFTAAQVRKDFSMFRFTGKKKVGYNVNSLLAGIDLLLHNNETPRAVLCGSSAPGLALLAAQKPLTGAAIIAAFDDAPPPPSVQPSMPVLPLDAMFGFIPQNRISIGIIAAPAARAQGMLDFLVLAGIRGVLNLSGAELKSPKRCIVSSVNVSRELEKLAFLVRPAGNNRKRSTV